MNTPMLSLLLAKNELAFLNADKNERARMGVYLEGTCVGRENGCTECRAWESCEDRDLAEQFAFINDHAS